MTKVTMSSRGFVLINKNRVGRWWKVRSGKWDRGVPQGTFEGITDDDVKSPNFSKLHELRTWFAAQVESRP